MTADLDFKFNFTEADLSHLEAALEINYGRDLTEADLSLLEVPRPPVSHLKRLGERHHELARCLARGLKPSEAAAIVGMSNVHVSIVQSDPSFKDLVTFYREKVIEESVDLHRRLLTLSKDAVAELQMRMEEEPEKFSRSELLEIAKTTADRAGHGPSATQTVNVNVGLAGRMEAARRRIEEVRRLQASPPPTDFEEATVLEGEVLAAE
jgi:hypothetical protein